MFGFARFKNEEYTLYLRLFGFARFYFDCMQDIVLSVCLDSLALRTKKDIVFSVCLSSLALRTTNIHCICVCLGSHACRLYGYCI